MSQWIHVARLSVVANVGLLGALSYVWVRNHLELRSRYTLGLTIFAGLLLARNLLSLYYYVGHPILREFFTTQMPALGWQAMVLLHLLETVALVFLLWVTFD